jgi:hypothetical protein
LQEAFEKEKNKLLNEIATLHKKGDMRGKSG